MMETISNLIGGVTSKVWLGILGILFGLIVALGIYSYFTSASLDRTKEKLTTAKAEIEQKDRDIGNLIEGYNATLEIERARNTFEITTQKEKESLIKVTEKVKQEVQNVKKYKEIKQDEKECPKLGTFNL